MKTIPSSLVENRERVLGELTEVGKCTIVQSKTFLPIGIVLKSNLTSRTLPILDFTPTRVNPLVMIIPLSHIMGYMLAILEVYALPGTHLTIYVLDTEGVERCLGCGLTSYMSTVCTA